VTGEPLIQRPDDREDVVLARLQQFEKESRPVIDFYEYVSKQLTKHIIVYFKIFFFS